MATYKERTREYLKEFGVVDTASLKKVKFEVNDAQAETDDVTITLNF